MLISLRQLPTYTYSYFNEHNVNYIRKKKSFKVETHQNVRSVTKLYNVNIRRRSQKNHWHPTPRTVGIRIFSVCQFMSPKVIIVNKNQRGKKSKKRSPQLTFENIVLLILKEGHVRSIRMPQGI